MKVIASFNDIAKLNLIWSSIPSQLARENKKFLYNAVKEGARAREYEDALTWLCNAGMTYKIYRMSKPGLPVSAYDDLGSFKLYAVDVGILRRLSRLDPSAEVDFIIQYGNDIYPIKVKSDENVKSRSLRIYIDKYKPKLGLRLSLRNLKYDNDVLNIPIFLSEYIDKLISLALQ